MSLFDTSDFPARWNCGRWTALHGWTHVTADVAIWAAYTSIPLILIYFVRRHRVPWPAVFWLFAAFILACGLTHLIEATIFWWPIYRISALMKVATALVSWITVFALLPLIPRAFALPALEQSNLALQEELRERAERLRKSEEQLRLMVNAVNEYAVIMLDPRGLITSWNAGAERIKGYPAAEVIGRPIAQLYTSADLAVESIEAKLDRAVKDGVVEENVWLTRKDGTRFLANNVISAVYDETGALRGFANVARDVTARMREERKFRSLLEAAPDALVIVNRQGEMVLVNSQTESLFGYERSELLGQKVELLVPESVRTAHAQQRAAYSNAPRRRPMGSGNPLQARRKDGSMFPAEISLSPLETEDGLLIMSAIRDITDRCRTEERIEHIEQMNAALLQSRALVETRNKQLLAANRELNEFAYIASHDLQEPLRKLCSFSRLLPMDMGGDLPPKAAEDIQFITDAATRMQVLIQDLLLLSRTASEAMRRERVSLDACADRAIDTLGERIEAAGAVIERDPLPSVSGDETLITQLYQNLIGNAVKYRVPGRPPHVRLTVGAQKGELVLGVQDDGIGIKPEYADVVFAPFKRLHGRGEYEGSGIGLAICRKVVERHGGRIWVESSPGRGSHFRFTLPANEESESWRSGKETARSSSL